MGETILEATDLRTSYGTSKVLHGVSLSIDRGDVIALIGRNGVGKTTLLKCLMGINRLDTGTVLFEQKKAESSIHGMSKAGIAYVPQGREIFSDFTVRENLEFGAVNENKDEIEKRFVKIMEYFPALKPHLERRGGVLSGGQQQQLAIGRALMSSPKLLLLDEPTEGIQPNVVAGIADILSRVHREMNLPIVIVEQNLKFAMKHANRFVCMQKGQIVAEGTKEELTQEMIDRYLKV